MKDFFTDRLATIQTFLETQKGPGSEWIRIFSGDFWLSSNAPAQSPYYLAALVFAGIFIMGIYIWRLRLKRLNQNVPVYTWPIDQLANVLFFFIALGLAYLFFRSQGIAYLSSKLFLLSVILVSIGWLGWITVYLLRVVPRKRQSHLEKERFFRYLPKDKKGNQ